MGTGKGFAQVLGESGGTCGGVQGMDAGEEANVGKAGTSVVGSTATVARSRSSRSSDEVVLDGGVGV